MDAPVGGVGGRGQGPDRPRRWRIGLDPVPAAALLGFAIRDRGLHAEPQSRGEPRARKGRIQAGGLLDLEVAVSATGRRGARPGFELAKAPWSVKWSPSTAGPPRLGAISSVVAAALAHIWGGAERGGLVSGVRLRASRARALLGGLDRGFDCHADTWPVRGHR